MYKWKLYITVIKYKAKNIVKAYERHFSLGQKRMIIIVNIYKSCKYETILSL